MAFYTVTIQYLLLFALGGMAGWVLELFFRRLVHGEWVNPGFLNGPLLPLYGFGTVILYAISDLALEWWWKLPIFFILLTAVEYMAGIIFIKGMGLKLWDYSKCWGNIQGIICPLFSLAWLAVGAVFLFLLYEPLHVALSWMADNLAFTFFLGLVYGVLLVDAGLSFNVSLRLRALARKAREALPFEQIKSYVARSNKEARMRLRFLLPFRSRNLQQTLDNYLSELKKKAKQALGKDEDDDR